MAVIIKDGTLVPDPWQRLELTADRGFPAVPPAADVIVPLAMWQGLRAELRGRAGRCGVWLAPEEGPEAIAGDLGLFGVVAVNFPKFTDGRGYSIGRLLRERYGYEGELRAIGAVQRDQLSYLARCGFNAFVLREGEDVEAALAAFGELSEAYQASVERPVPLFRRRHAALHDRE
jgi:uncharacterized protein (DUF934 family)